jgi:hypothetical protein
MELITGLSAFAASDMRAGDAAAPFVSWATRAELLNHIRLSSQARCTLPIVM